MRRSSVALVLLLAACSSGSGTTTLSSPEPVLPTATGTPAVPSPTAARPSPTPLPTPSPTARRTASPVPSVVPAATSRPTPRPTPSPTRSGATFGVDEVTGDRFSPSALTLRSGDRVVVTNRDVGAHTFTISSLGVDSGNMGQGDTFRYTFRAPGRYTFVCTYHEGLGMTGTLTVTR